MWVQSPGREDPLEEGNPLQCSCLENPTDRGFWRATAHGVSKSRLSDLARTHARTFSIGLNLHSA